MKDKTRRLALLEELLRKSKSRTKEKLIERLSEVLGYAVGDRMFYRDLRDLKHVWGREIPKPQQGEGYDIKWRVPSASTEPSPAILSHAKMNLVAGAPLRMCLKLIDQEIQRYKRIDRRFPTSREVFADKGAEILEQLVNRFVSVLSPRHSGCRLEDQVGILKENSGKFAGLIKEARLVGFDDDALPSESDTELLEKLLALRNTLLKPSAWVYLKRQKELRLADDVMNGLDSLCRSHLAQTVVAIERKNLKLG